MTKQLQTLIAVLIGITAFGTSAIAQETMVIIEAKEATPITLSVGANIASAYVFRGETRNDGIVAQPWVDIATSFGLNLGGWANFDFDDYDGTIDKNEFSEIDIYVGWKTKVADMVALGVEYCEYIYPNGGSANREISINTGLPIGPIGIGLAAYFGVDGEIEKTIYLEATAEYDIDVTEEISVGVYASAAYLLDDNKAGEDGFKDYTVGASLAYRIFSASVKYIGQGESKVLPEEQYRYDVEVVGMLSVGYKF